MRWPRPNRRGFRNAVDDRPVDMNPECFSRRRPLLQTERALPRTEASRRCWRDTGSSRHLHEPPRRREYQRMARLFFSSYARLSGESFSVADMALKDSRRLHFLCLRHPSTLPSKVFRRQTSEKTQTEPISDCNAMSKDSPVLCKNFPRTAVSSYGQSRGALVEVRHVCLTMPQASQKSAGRCQRLVNLIRRVQRDAIGAGACEMLPRIRARTGAVARRRIH